MGFFSVVIGLALAVFMFYVGARWVAGARRNREVRNGELPTRDLGANINPSQQGNEVDLWPDRTGARTRRELGARRAANVTYAGDREEGGRRRGHAAGPVAAPAARPEPGATRREVKPGPHEHGPGTQAKADLAPEDEFGEDRPARRTTAADNPPTQWHPDQHGVPGDHYREGHHRSATAPEKESTATDPSAHAPIPGPNHISPQDGSDFPPGVRP